MKILSLLMAFALVIPLGHASVYIPAQAFPKPRPIPEPKLSFQVIQTEFLLDQSTINKASMRYDAKRQYHGLLIELKPTAAAQLTQITENAVGKHLNLVLDNKIVSSLILHSSLSKRFVLISLPKDQAQALLNYLQFKKITHDKTPI